MLEIVSSLEINEVTEYFPILHFRVPHYLVISNWVTANPSLEKKSAKMVVYSNVLAVKKG